MLSPSASSRANCACCAGRPSSSKKSARAGGNSLSGGQRHPVDVGLRARDRVVVEARESRGDLLDLVVELVVGDHPVDVPVLLRARSVEIVGDEEDLERPAAADQAGEPAPSDRPRDHTGADLELAEQRVLARGEPQVTGEHELASGAAGAAADRGDADHRGTGQAHEEVEPCVHSGRTAPSAAVLPGSCSAS